MSSPLMISVAGVRGIVGDSLTPPVAARFGAAFAREMSDGEIVIGRDARVSGPMLERAVVSGVLGAGRSVANLGLATTPAAQIAVETLRAAGGILLTASHNPAPWNALKFLSARGEFLDVAAGAAVRRRYDSGHDLWVGFDRIGVERHEARADGWHVERVLGLDFLEPEAIRRRALRVVVDGCASAGGVTFPRLLRQLGCQVVELDCEPNGAFTRELEPLPEHLGALGRAVREASADFGVALDPDADRAAFVDRAGIPLGEECTLALAAQVVLARRPGPVVTNLSTSRMIEHVCARVGVPLTRTAVGEAHVVEEMRARGAVVGGEGNGGVILPAAHYGRDGLVAVGLVCQALAASGGTIRELAEGLPRLAMVKEKTRRPEEPWGRTVQRLLVAFPEFTVEDRDGVRLSRGGEWVHVRVSGTEPVARVIAEAETDGRAGELAAVARRALRGES